jgi:hypothetical protein
MGRRPASVNDTLGDPLMVEVGDLLAEVEVLEQRRPSGSGFERVLIIVDRDALVGRQPRRAGVIRDGPQLDTLWIDRPGAL